VSTTDRGTNRLLRIDPEELKRRMESGELVTILDVRAPEAWETSDRKIRGAIRRNAANLNLDTSWPKERLTVTYCT